MRLLICISILLLSTVSLAAKDQPLSREDIEKKRWNQIHNLIEQEIATINQSRRKNQKILYRLFELKSEKIKLYKEKENNAFMAKKLRHGKRIKRKDIFKKTIKLYKDANKFGHSLLRRFPHTKYKAAIYYTLALNSRDFAYDNKELSYLRDAIKFSKGQNKVNYLARTSLGEYYYNNKKWKAAIYQYEIVLKNADDEWYTKNLLNFGWCLLKSKRFNEAINSLEKSYQLGGDDFYVDVRDQAITGLVSFYVLGKQINRGVKFIDKYSINKNQALLKLARKASNKGYYEDTQKIVKTLEKRIQPKVQTELYADLRLFQFELYKQYHKSKKLIKIAHLFPKVKFNDYQREDAIRKISDIVGAKQVILKKDYSKFDQNYDKSSLSQIITYFNILAAIDPKEKALYEFYKAETYYSVERLRDALVFYKLSLVDYDKFPSKEDLRHKNMDAIFSSIENIPFKKDQKVIELDFAYNKYLSYWPKDKKARKIFPRLFSLYLTNHNYSKTQKTIDRYAHHFKKDLKKQQDLYRVLLDTLITIENTELLALNITKMQKGYLKFKSSEVKKSEEILANILFKRYQQLNKSGNPKGALAGYQKVHYTNYYPDSIKGEAAFNMGMIYTDLSDNNNAMKWYKKSFNFYSKKEIKMKRAFLEKMALRTSLLHNFLNAAKLNKFIVKSFCEDKKENLPIFIAAIRDDLANNYISKVMHTLEKQSHCINKVPLNLKKEILVHLYENNHESDFMSFIRSYKLEKSFKDDIGYYYEQYFWKYYKESPIKSNQFLIRLKKLNNSTSKLLTKSLQRYENFLKKTKLFSKVRITIKKKNPNPNLFINNLTKRIDRLKTISASANKIFSMGHGQVSVLVYDKLTKLADDFATEINNYHIPIDDANFQKQFSHEMDKISSSMVLESNKFKDSSQKLIEKYELLLIRREESHLSFSILQISDIRTPASKMAITTGLGK